jgi:hypothetical protein
MNMFLLMISFLLINGCGTERTVENRTPAPQPGPAPTPDPGDDNDELSYPEMQALLNSYCLSCHASARFMQSEQALRGSRVEEELLTRSMPPPNANKQLPDAERSLMISFF